MEPEISEQVNSSEIKRENTTVGKHLEGEIPEVEKIRTSKVWNLMTIEHREQNFERSDIKRLRALGSDIKRTEHAAY